jgi:predicted TIM-barrel fold metal-dependent hydrolase
MQTLDALAFVGNGVYKSQSAEALIHEMNLNDVSKTIIAPVDEYITVYNEQGNHDIIEICNKHPDRLLAYAVANPWYGKKAVTILKSALKNGACAVYFDSSEQGFSINDHLVDPLIEVCEEFDVPVYFHTGTPAFALPFQLHYLAARFPNVRFIMGHSGANDFVADALPSLFNRDNIWLDTSMNLTITIASFIDKASDKTVFGSASPRSRLKHELEKLHRARPNSQQLEKICSSNLMKVMGVRK